MSLTNHGFFVFSLDFEMYWGVRDVCSLPRYKQEFSGERERIPELLRLFERYGIHATWAVVGLLFFEHKKEMDACRPDLLPQYENRDLSPYDDLESDSVGAAEDSDPNHYALSLIREIQKTPNQYVATHTFSHYYCLEKGQTAQEFAADLEAAVRVAKQKGITLESLVFPRNQMNADYLPILASFGIRSYRGNPSHPLHRKGNRPGDSLPFRALRLLDSYLNLTGHHTYDVSRKSNPDEALPVNIPASQFLRSHSKALRWLEPLRIRRILSGMTRAARKGQVYHLWCHPYNLADHEGENMNNLHKIIAHYERLNRKYGMKSASMEELSDLMTGREDKRMVDQSPDIRTQASETEVVGSGI